MAKIAKNASNLLMFIIPKFRTWKQIQPLMRINHWLMSKYGYWEKDYGFKEYVAVNPNDEGLRS